MRKHIDLSCLGSPAGWLAAGVLLCASGALAQAQLAAPNNVQATAPGTAPGAAGLAPSGNAAAAPQAPRPASVTTQVPAPSVVTLPPQIGVQGPSQTPAQLPTVQVPAQGSAALQAPNAPANQSAGLPAAPDGKRGLFNDLGKWWDDSIANFNAKMKEQQAKLDEFNKQQAAAAKYATEKMKNAADAMFTPSKVIEVQQQPCPVAGNGAPDCASAAANLCKAKGFSDGRPMDIRTAERCKASLWVSGQAPTAADCSMETVLLRVACQP